MIAQLVDLTLRGSLAFLVVWLLDLALARSTRSRWRRWWWVCVPLAFLALWKIPLLPAPPTPYLNDVPAVAVPPLHLEETLRTWAVASAPVPWFAIWIVGAAGTLGILLIQTFRASRAWRGERFCTDSRLLDLLEDCKARAGVTAPIGLVLTDRLDAPAILGWLRPRILLPRQLAGSLEPTRLAHVFWHELAHFRAGDVPIGWLFALARAVHWFNPFAHLAGRAWARFREEAADEQAIAWARGGEPTAYGQTLLAVIREGSRPSPAGALAITESFSNLKRRIHMISRYPQKSTRTLLALAALALLASLAFLQPARAQEGDPKSEAVKAMESWLRSIDAGDYASSWSAAATSFQKAISSDKWVAALNSVRQPLGACESRTLASALHQTEVPAGGGKTIKGDFVIAQFNTSFANLKYAVETVTFEKDGGLWKASGYYIKPAN